jgi:hypothetical protein
MGKTVKMKKWIHGRKDENKKEMKLDRKILEYVRSNRAPPADSVECAGPHCAI